MSIGLEKKKLNNMCCIPEVFYKEFISQFEGLPLDSLLYENLISCKVYEKLKRFNMVNI